MPGMNVVRCNGCQMYQVEIQKKAKKWQCKVCGAKQSLMQVFFQGTGKECRLQVQHLNALKANKGSENSDSYFNSNYHNTASQFSSLCDSTLSSMKRTRSEAQSDFDDSSFGIPNIIADDDEHLHKKFKFDSSTEDFSDSSTRHLLTSQGKDQELENLIECRFAAENSDDNFGRLQNENFNLNSSQKTKRKDPKRFFEASQQTNFPEETDHSTSIFSNLLDDEDDCDLQTDAKDAEEGFSNFDNVLENNRPEENFFEGTKDSIFSNLLSENESDTEEAVILSRGNKELLSPESSLDDDKKCPIRQSEPEYSIFESNGEIDLSIDF